MNAAQRKRLLKLAVLLEKAAKEIGRLSLEMHQAAPAKKAPRTKLVSVGKGSWRLEERAKRRGWKLFSYVGGKLQSGWSGDSPMREYFIRTA